MREKFRKQLEEFLARVQFKEENSNLWILERQLPSQKTIVTVNGQPHVHEQEGAKLTYRIKVVGEAEIDKQEAIQILFELSEENAILREHEEVFYCDDFNWFQKIFTEVF